MAKGSGIDGIKGIMFDCYKTLIDIKTDEKSLATYDMVSRWLAYHGVKISPADLMDEYKGRCREAIECGWERHAELKVEEIFARICAERACWSINELTVGMEAARIFRSASVKRLQAFPQSIKLLNCLKGYPLGIISNGQRVFSENELRHLGLYGYFDFVIFSSDFGYKKPDHRIFLAGADRLGLKPEEVLYIGDSNEKDLIPSRELGMKAMHIEDAWRFFKVA